MEKPVISIIVAIAENGVIGQGNKLPWRLPADFDYFKKITAGHPLIMGYRTHLSIGKVLPGRKNIVLCNDENFEVMDGAIMANSFEEAFKLAKDSDEAFIIGGASVYARGLNYAERLYITEVQADVEGDVIFPEFDKSKWKEIKREKRKKDMENIYDLDFVVYDKI